MREAARRWVLPVLLLVTLTVVVVGLLTQPDRGVDRTYALQQQLRCPACKTVSIVESPSQTAAAMRQQVAEQVAAGRTDEQVLDYFRARYGDWVVLDPPVGGATLLVWLLPLAAAGLGLVVLAALPRHGVPPPLPAAERERVRLELAGRAAAGPRDEEP